MLVMVEGEYYLQCEESAKNFWASSKPGYYGRGMLNTKDDPTRTERVGLLGQAAFSILTGLPTDFSYKKGGDKYDFLLNGYKIDLKTASKDYGAALIKCVNEWGKNCFKKHDIYVAGYLVADNNEERVAQVCFKGYELGSRVENFPVKNARRGIHKNYELTYNSLQSLDKLLEFVRGNSPFSSL